VILDKHKFIPDKIYYLNETASTTVHTPHKVVACKGIKQVVSITSGERGPNVKFIACINALGNSIPPMFIFPYVPFKEPMLKGGPSGCLGMAHISGCSNSSIFVEYMKHFIQHVKPSNSNKVLLFLTTMRATAQQKL
jgi:hypothetical protein